MSNLNTTENLSDFPNIMNDMNKDNSAEISISLENNDNRVNEDQMLMEMRTIFGGCDSTLDAIQMSEPLFIKYPQYKQLIVNYRDAMTYPDNIDLMTKIASLDAVLQTESRDDALTLKNSLTSRSNDAIYNRTLDKIVSRKRNNRASRNTIYNAPTKLISKECPHCGETMRMPEGTTYVICGYPDTQRGYDWRGCCEDWCFSCGKMLCKTWDKDDLNVEGNRHHDDVCCKAHAKRNGHAYPEDYCHCIQNHNVTRKDYIPEMLTGMRF